MAEHPLHSTALKDLTYPFVHPKNNTLDENIHTPALPLDNGRHHLDPQTDLGLLDTLPIEILDEVLVHVDLETLTKFRRVNQRAMQRVDSLPQYRTILKHSPASLRGILAIGTGSLISSQDLFRTLTTAACENCQDFGAYIYLLTRRRVCFLCFSEQEKYLPLLATEVKRKFGLSTRFPDDIPCMRSIPGMYSLMVYEKFCRTRLTLYDHESARRPAEKYHGSTVAMNEYVMGVSSKSLAAYNKRLSNWERTKNGPKPDRPPKTVAWDGEGSNPRRFMAIVRTPWLNQSTKLEDWEFHCLGCRGGHSWPLHSMRKHSAYTFEQHIRECGQVKRTSDSYIRYSHDIFTAWGTRIPQY